MPLPSVLKHGAKQCHATAKHSRCQCLNPAAYGMNVCRFHGARRKETILKGEAHPLYKHGQETLQMKTERSAGLARIRALEGLMHKYKMTSAKRTPGRKPTAR